ncbi:hypothetical protein CYQ88_10035 [Hydrogenovibrio sp. SC-1]|uniref:tyrosine-type recombinase/integrase n=1 Tax=Hydrogenovibrio sp. SC-1 TaxID=2065820 RepID=UPI000C7DEB60|nr:tyrosine-type recombinase/integrase [Hydrogenovibrio sp. SC-1]PLA73653.1 hypothetical protein CYQ88_10035 [Hydrogenovibrio sp. SC-1]
MPKIAEPITLFKLNCFIDDAKHQRTKRLSDGHVPGLRYDTKKSGVAVVLKYKKTNGKYSSHTLEVLKFQSITKSKLSEIRKQAMQLKAGFEEKIQICQGSTDKTLVELFALHQADFSKQYRHSNNLRSYSAPGTIRILKAVFRKYTFFNDLPLHDFNEQTELNFINMAQIPILGRKKQIKLETIRKYISALRSFLRYLVSIGEIEVFPFGKYPLKDTSVEKKTAINPERFKELADFLFEMNNQASDFYYLLLTTGARKNEITELKKHNINLVDNILQLDKTKNGKARNAYILNERMREVLLRNQNNHSEYLFYDPCSKHGIVNIDEITAMINEHFNLAEFTAHSARHSFAVYLYDLNVDINSIKDRLGHSSIQQTLRYLGSLDVFKEEKAKQVNSLIAGAF